MKKIIIFAFSLLAVGYLQAQYAGGGTPTTTSGNAINSVAAQAISQYLGPISDADVKRQKDSWFANAQGSPYTSNKFTPATLFYGEEKIGNIYYRYNALNEEIEIKKTIFEDEGYRGLTNDKKAYILVNGMKMSFKTFVTSKKRTTNGYLTELYDGSEYDLYKRTHVKFTEATPSQNSFVAAVPARFTKFTEYYFQKKGVNRIDEVLPKKGKLLKLLESDKKAKVKAFLKENDLNIKKEADLITVFEFLNK